MNFVIKSLVLDYAVESPSVKYIIKIVTFPLRYYYCKKTGCTVTFLKVFYFKKPNKMYSNSFDYSLLYTQFTK